MARGDLGPVPLLQGLLEDLHVHVAQALDLLGRQPLVDQGLLHGRDLGRVHPAQHPAEPLLHLFHGGAVMELAQDRLEGLLTLLRPLRRAGHRLPQGAHQVVHRDAGDRGRVLQGGHLAHGLPQERVPELGERGGPGHQHLEQVGVLPKQVVDPGLGADLDGHDHLLAVGSGLAAVYPGGRIAQGASGHRHGGGRVREPGDKVW